MEQSRAATRITSTSTPWRTLGVVAAIMAFGLLWLALDGSAGSTPAAQGRDGTAAAKARMPSLPLAGQPGFPALAPSSPPATEKVAPPGTSADNVAALALGGAGAVAMTGFVLLLALKRRSAPGMAAPAKPRRLLRIARGASLF